MLFGRVRWSKSLGAPVGDPGSGFRILVQEHTASQFREGAGGPEVVPGTGIWRPAESVPCSPAPDEGDMHVVRFNVPDVHLNAFPDGKYRVSAELTGNWAESRLQAMLGFRRIEPIAFYVVLTKDNHLSSVDFEVIQEPWRFRFG
jgi:hypothetical protein